METGAWILHHPARLDAVPLPAPAAGARVNSVGCAEPPLRAPPVARDPPPTALHPAGSCLFALRLRPQARIWPRCGPRPPPRAPPHPPQLCTTPVPKPPGGASKRASDGKAALKVG